MPYKYLKTSNCTYYTVLQLHAKYLYSMGYLSVILYINILYNQLFL